MITTEDTRDASLCAKLATDLDGNFEEMVVLFQDRLYSFALRLTGGPRDAEEVAQDVFVRAYRALGGYPADQVRGLAIRAWLYRITLNVARNRMRGKRLAMVSLDGESEEGQFDDPADDSPGPDVLAEQADEKARLGALVAALPERYRSVVVLRYVADLPYAEMAEVLKQPIGTVKANVHRGIALLRAAINGQEDSVPQVMEVGK